MIFLTRREIKSRSAPRPDWITDTFQGKEYEWKETPSGYTARFGGQERTFVTGLELEEWLTATC